MFVYCEFYKIMRSFDKGKIDATELSLWMDPGFFSFIRTIENQES